MWRSPSCCWRKWQSATKYVMSYLIYTKQMFAASLAKETLVNTCISEWRYSVFCLAFKWSCVFTAERWLRHQASRVINAWATELLRVLFNTATHWTVPPISTHISANGSLDSQREIIYPFALTGEQLYKLWFGQYLWTFNRNPPEPCRSVSSH